MEYRNRETNLACAQLDGLAQRATRERWSVDYAVERLRQISDQPDVLARAAGPMIGGWVADPVGSGHLAIPAAGLLILAGADLLTIEQWVTAGRDNRSQPHHGQTNARTSANH